MKTKTLLILIAFAILGCATAAPKELIDARAANLRAKHGPAASVAPAELHIADLALAAAEVSFKSDPDSYRAQDLAYVAQRKAQLAEATASIINEKGNQARANEDYQKTQANIVTDTKKSLNEANTALDQSETALATSDAALKKSQMQTADALAALAKLAAVKEEERGLVITLSGSVLFASNQSVLLPEAQTRLNQVCDVLLSTRERSLVIEGHTDSQGSDGDNMNLSQRRADAVRDYIVSRGYEGDLVRAAGMGEGHPVADNNSAEGRANNRRVEIIIARDPKLSMR
jgi:outer membrane protein OmpA-like peptidoglycan-associated protein